MVKLYATSILLLLLVHCKEGPEAVQDTTSEDASLAVSELPAKKSVQAGAGDLVSNWVEYQSLDTSMDELYRVENNEELRLLIDELLEKEKALSGSEYPELFDKPQILSRQKVFKTYLLKTKASLEYRTDTQEAASEMIRAYNDFCHHFNILVNSRLDTTLLSDE